MIKRIVHIGVAVKDLKISNDIFMKLLGAASPHSEKIEEQKATISFYPLGESSVELIESSDETSPIAKFIERRGEGMHHLCLEVDDIRYEIDRLKKLGFSFVNDLPSAGGDGCLVAFLHPKSTNGVLVELSERIEPEKGKRE